MPPTFIPLFCSVFFITEKIVNCDIIYTVHGCFLTYLLHIKCHLVRGYKVFKTRSVLVMLKIGEVQSEGGSIFMVLDPFFASKPPRYTSTYREVTNSNRPIGAWNRFNTGACKGNGMMSLYCNS